MSRPTRGPGRRFPVRGCHPLRRAFPDASGTKLPCHWPGPRSLATTDGVSRPLLSQRSMLMSFPPATEMFQFAGFASRTYGFSTGYPLRGGLPHSEIPGSPIARISPGLVAACHVLHRLSVPRHPPNALIALDLKPLKLSRTETKSCVLELLSFNVSAFVRKLTMGIFAAAFAARESAHLRPRITKRPNPRSATLPIHNVQHREKR